MADALATLASMIMVKYWKEVPNLFVMRLDRPAHMFVVEEIKERSHGYYSLTMESDCCKFVKKFHKCQVYAKTIHVPPTLLNVISSPCPFFMWGIDMIGMIEPKASNGHRFILVAIDYFTKWVEAASYANVTKKVVVRFIKNQIIC
ncbi:hypothetical protein KIW84_021270 [Lathyrus oleraceus]|uniref:Uncharacterized protein n=1 Tax=Pisum sativum TaxID=3888 RepID=A0A9D4Y8L4_PEA|nr:hypothetical protein KIW84_021270 [Pisum sativum]